MVLAVDIGVILITLLSLISGWRNGFMETIFSIAAWVGGLLIAFHGSRPVLEALPDWADAIPGAEFVVGVLLFLVAFVVIRLIGHAAGSSGERAIDPGDKGLGGLLGLVRGAALAAILASVLVAALPLDSRILRQSRTLPLLAPLGETVARAAPPWLQERMVVGWRAVRGRSEPAMPRTVSAEARGLLVPEPRQQSAAG